LVKVEEWSTAHTCSGGMDRVVHYRQRAEHLRQLAELTWQEGLETMLRDLADQYDGIAASIEAAPSKELEYEIGADRGSARPTSRDDR
jgi:hypothetical protein